MADDSTTNTDTSQGSATDTKSQGSGTGSDDTSGADALGDAGKKALAAMKAERQEAQRQARSAQKELADLKAASMSQTEKEIAAAEAKGRSAATAEYARELARSHFDVAAARRNPDFDTASALEWVDPTRFLDENGRPDPKAIRAAVERLVPESPKGPPSFDGGARTSAAKGVDMNQLMRQRLGRE